MTQPKTLRFMLEATIPQKSGQKMNYSKIKDSIMDSLGYSPELKV